MTELNIQELLDQAEWEVNYAKGEVQKAHQKLELRQLALDNLKKKYEAQLEINQQAYYEEGQINRVIQKV